MPLWASTLPCRNASPDPSASSTKPNPFSGLNHLTTPLTGGPEGASKRGWMNRGRVPNGRGCRWSVSASNSRRRELRKSRFLKLGSWRVMPDQFGRVRRDARSRSLVGWGSGRDIGEVRFYDYGPVLPY